MADSGSSGYLRKPDLLLCLCHFEQPMLPFVVGLLTYFVFFALGLAILTAVAALRDSTIPQCKFVLTVDGLQIFVHENTPVSRTVYASRIYYPRYGSIVSYLRVYGRSPLGIYAYVWAMPKHIEGRVAK